MYIEDMFRDIKYTLQRAILKLSSSNVFRHIKAWLPGHVHSRTTHFFSSWLVKSFGALTAELFFEVQVLINCMFYNYRFTTNLH